MTSTTPPHSTVVLLILRLQLVEAKPRSVCPQPGFRIVLLITLCNLQPGNQSAKAQEPDGVVGADIDLHGDGHTPRVVHHLIAIAGTGRPSPLK